MARQSLSRSPAPPKASMLKGICANLDQHRDLQKKSTLKMGVEGGGRRGLNSKAFASTHAVDCRVKNSTLGSLERSTSGHLHWICHEIKLFEYLAICLPSLHIRCERPFMSYRTCFLCNSKNGSGEFLMYGCKICKTCKVFSHVTLKRVAHCVNS